MNESILGKYRILVQLGEGQASNQYLAEDTTLHRKVTLRLTTHEPGAIESFQREAWRSAALSHPNVATIYEVGTDGEFDYIASEWLEGGTLKQRLQQGPLSVQETLNIAICIARALQVSHEAWIVHRDVRPENIMLRSTNRLSRLDFTIAALVGGGEDVDPLRSPAGRMRVLSYLSPEQVRGETIIDSRSDTYSLGVVIYEMLSGAPPFMGRATLDILASIVERDPDPLDSSIPARLRNIVNRALEKNIHDRYQTAEEMLDDLVDLRLDLEMEEREKTARQLN